VRGSGDAVYMVEQCDKTPHTADTRPQMCEQWDKMTHTAYTRPQMCEQQRTFGQRAR